MKKRIHFVILSLLVLFAIGSAIENEQRTLSNTISIVENSFFLSASDNNTQEIIVNHEFIVPVRVMTSISLTSPIEKSGKTIAFQTENRWPFINHLANIQGISILKATIIRI